MRGPYSDYAAPPVYLYPDTPRPGVHFSRTELIQLGVAILALSAAFTLAYIRSDLFSFTRSPAEFLAIIFPAALLAVATGVGLHEIMHKVVAERYGFWAEFRYNPRGLLFAIVLVAAFWVVAGSAKGLLGGLLLIYLLQVAQINAVLAGFNLVPILPLDGAKV